MIKRDYKSNEKRRIAGKLLKFVDEIREKANEVGLGPFGKDDVRFWVVDQDEMNRAIALDGFTNRYTHWRWGMKYKQQEAMDKGALGTAYEIVNSDNPAHALLKKTNSIVKQKAVIAHVFAHVDFFRNNQYFDDDPRAAEMLETHSKRIDSILEDPNIDREDVERWIEYILSIQNTIDQYGEFNREIEQDSTEGKNVQEQLESLPIDEEVIDNVFDEEWIEEQETDDESTRVESKDVLAYIEKFGMQYDEEEGRAVEFEDWQREIISMLRKEEYYFAPQKMTKTINEGWASFWESLIMTREGILDEDEVFEYADYHSKILDSEGFNPYQVGRKLWEYVENKENRKEVVKKLLRVEGIFADNFFEEIDFEYIRELLEENRDYDSVVERNYSLLEPENLSFLSNISQEEVRQLDRYIMHNKYDSVEEAIDDVDYSAGWEAMFERRKVNNDISFFEQYLNQEFVDEQGYYAFEHDPNSGIEITGSDVEKVRKKMLLNTANFGKPTIIAADKNYNNRNELLLEHLYNGVMINVDKMEKVLERVFELWGRPVNLKTVVKKQDEDTRETGEQGLLIRYDGDEISHEELDWEFVEHLVSDVSYDTTED